jgi:hypothetical protein
VFGRRDLLQECPTLQNPIIMLQLFTSIPLLPLFPPLHVHTYFLLTGALLCLEIGGERVPGSFDRANVGTGVAGPPETGIFP